MSDAAEPPENPPESDGESSEPKPRMSDVFEAGDTPIKPKKKRTTLALLAFLLAALGTCLGLMALGATLFLPVLERGRQRGQRNLCFRNVRDIARASLLYAMDNDDTLSPGERWPEAVATYNNRPLESLLVCPTANFGHKNRYGLAMSEDLAGQVVSEIEDETAPFVFDSTDFARGAVAGIDTLPRPGRHFGRRRGNVMALLSGATRFIRDPEPGAPLGGG